MLVYYVMPCGRSFARSVSIDEYDEIIGIDPNEILHQEPNDILDFEHFPRIDEAHICIHDSEDEVHKYAVEETSVQESSFGHEYFENVVYTERVEENLEKLEEKNDSDEYVISDSDEDYEPIGNRKNYTKRGSSKRSQFGCWICRLKHKKCDEAIPSCSNCSKQRIRCDYSERRPIFITNKSKRSVKLKEIHDIWLNRYKLQKFLKGDKSLKKFLINNNSYNDETMELIRN